MFQLLSNLFFLQNLLSKIVALFLPPILIHNLGKYLAIKKAFYLTGLENLQGDYVEFGVFTGSSMACAIQVARHTGVKYAHRFVNFWGFDSFAGFGELSEKNKHPFYTDLNFKTDENSVRKRLNKLVKAGQTVKLIPGHFSKTCDNVFPEEYGIRKAAIIMMDNDTFAAAKTCFKFCETLIQEGTIFIIDDYFS